MNYGGFLPYGALIIAFALALHRTVRSAAGGWLGPMLLGVYGLAYVALALEPVTTAAPRPLRHWLTEFIFSWGT